MYLITRNMRRIAMKRKEFIITNFMVLLFATVSYSINPDNLLMWIITMAISFFGIELVCAIWKVVIPGMRALKKPKETKKAKILKALIALLIVVTQIGTTLMILAIVCIVLKL